MDPNSFVVVSVLGLFLAFLIVLILVNDSRDTLSEISRSVEESKFECLRTQLRELRAELELVRIAIEDFTETQDES